MDGKEDRDNAEHAGMELQRVAVGQMELPGR
jgi:hypothetical protein